MGLRNILVIKTKIYLHMKKILVTIQDTNHFLYHEKLRPAAQFLPSELASADFFVHQK